MIKRYSDDGINRISDPFERLKRFDLVELAAVCAEEKIGGILNGLSVELEQSLKENPPNEVRRRELEKTNDHDFMAYVMQRWEVLAPDLKAIFHKAKTTFDIQDPADQLALLGYTDRVLVKVRKLMDVVGEQAIKYWYTPLLLRTHGQGAHVGTFGKRLASYFADLELALNFIEYARKMLEFGKMSGIVGDYQNASSQIEELTLGIIGLKPYYGATQILPRSIHVILASSLAVLCGVLAKMAEDFQLMARSSSPLIQEPFKGGQVGSSASPAKKNTIKSENTAGMFRLALGDTMALFQNLITKEERDIAQSSVERVALIDMFHIAINALNNIIYVVNGMVVYRDHMMDEIIAMRGTEWAEAAKEFLVRHGFDYGITRDIAYAIVKQASHQAFYPMNAITKGIRTQIPQDEEGAITDYWRYTKQPRSEMGSIKNIIAEARLIQLSTIEVDRAIILQWNELLKEMFKNSEIRNAWQEVFNIQRIFAPQEILRQKIQAGRMNF